MYTFLCKITKMIYRLKSKNIFLAEKVNLQFLFLAEIKIYVLVEMIITQITY